MKVMPTAEPRGSDAGATQQFFTVVGASCGDARA